MNFQCFQGALTSVPSDWIITFRFPTGEVIPGHYHITEAARINKDFVDCGGVVRSQYFCVLQAWVANDSDHRITTGKLLKILAAGKGIFRDDLQVEIEYERNGILSQYPVVGVQERAGGLLFELESKHTGCLAPDKCGLEVLGCGPKGCC